MVTERNWHAYLGNRGSQVHPAPARPLLIGALEGLVAPEDGQLKDISVSGGDMWDALPKGVGDVAGGEVAGNLGHFVEDIVHTVLKPAHGLEVGHQRQRRDDDHSGGNHGRGPREPFVSLVVLHTARGDSATN